MANNTGIMPRTSMRHVGIIDTSEQDFILEYLRSISKLGARHFQVRRAYGLPAVSRLIPLDVIAISGPTVTCQDLVSMFSPIRRRSRAVTATMPSRGEISSGVWTRQPPAPARVAVLPNSVRGVILRDGGNDQNDQEDSKFTGGTRLHFWRGCNCREHGLIAPDPFSRCRHSHLIVGALAARPATGRATGGCFPPQGPFRSRAAVAPPRNHGGGPLYPLARSAVRFS